MARRKIIMAKTRKVLDLCANGKHFIAIESEGKYTLYRKWYENGWHRKKLKESTGIEFLLYYILKYEYGF